MLLARTAQQDAEENVVLEQAAVVEEARRKEAALRKAAAQPARPGAHRCMRHAIRADRTIPQQAYRLSLSAGGRSTDLLRYPGQSAS